VPAFIHRRLGEIVSSFDEYRLLNRWLDVGFGAGALMRAAAGRGWSVAGTEMSPSATEAVRALGFEVHLAQVQDLDLPGGSFDVISMVEVLEHVPDPDALLSAAARLLRPGGALYATTPHARGISARIMGTGWSAVSPPEHLQLYSVGGIRAALGRSRFKEKELHTHAVNPSELLAALRRRETGEPQASRVETSYRLNEALSSGRSRTLLKRLANGVLNAARVGDALKLVATADAGAPPLQVTTPRGAGKPPG
jgi:SAM-dependent methyltransferase